MWDDPYTLTFYRYNRTMVGKVCLRRNDFLSFAAQQDGNFKLPLKIERLLGRLRFAKT